MNYVRHAAGPRAQNNPQCKNSLRHAKWKFITCIVMTSAPLEAETLRQFECRPAGTGEGDSRSRVQYKASEPKT